MRLLEPSTGGAGRAFFSKRRPAGATRNCAQKDLKEDARENVISSSQTSG